MYKVKVNDSRTFEINADALKDIDIIKTTADHYHVLHHQQSIDATVTESDFLSKSYRVKINNTEYKVAISDTLDQQIEAMGFALGASKKVNSIKAPMPGLILEITANAGDTINEGDSLLILEAMKMENVITSPRDGVIKSIQVSKGDAVEKNQLLIEFE